MKLDQQIAKSIKEYPLLYRDINYEKSKLKVLNQLFLVGGSGFCWYDGYRCETDLMKKCEFDMNRGGWVGVKGPGYCKLKFEDTKFEDDYFTKCIPRDFIMKLSEELKKLLPEKFYDERADYDFKPYPQSSSDEWIPDFIQEDWREGFELVVDEAIKYWESDNWKKDEYRVNFTKESAIEQLRILNIIKMKLNNITIAKAIEE